MFLSAAFMIAISVLGGMNGLDEITDDGTVLQRSVAIASIIYSACGILAGVGVLMKRSWSLPLAILWGLVTTYTGSVASVAWAERGQPIFTSFVTALILCLVVCGVVVWGVRIAVRRTE